MEEGQVIRWTWDNKDRYPDRQKRTNVGWVQRACFREDCVICLFLPGYLEGPCIPSWTQAFAPRSGSSIYLESSGEDRCVPHAHDSLPSATPLRLTWHSSAEHCSILCASSEQGKGNRQENKDAHRCPVENHTFPFLPWDPVAAHL